MSPPLPGISPRTRPCVNAYVRSLAPTWKRLWEPDRTQRRWQDLIEASTGTLLAKRPNATTTRTLGHDCEQMNFIDSSDRGDPSTSPFSRILMRPIDPEKVSSAITPSGIRISADELRDMARVYAGSIKRKHRTGPGSAAPATGRLSDYIRPIAEGRDEERSTRAIQAPLGRQVAVKTIRRSRQPPRQGHLQARFASRAKGAGPASPYTHIAPIHAAGQDFRTIAHVKRYIDAHFPTPPMSFETARLHCRIALAPQ